VLVIAVDSTSPGPEQVRWAGRRHDDDGPESTGVQTAQGLFDAVFAALHDGEQVAIGFDCPLALPAANGTADDAADREMTELRRLITELGRWRPWTIITTSLARWRATTSVLVWEVAGEHPADRTAAIDAFFATLRGAPAADEGSGRLVNLAAAIAVESEATADPAEVDSPVLTIPVPAVR
jgi:hypothetical protein